MQMESHTRLLLLDINGLLCCKMPKISHCGNLEILNLNSYNVIMRPGCREFLEFCYAGFTVGFFSSTNKWNVDAILKKLLNSEQQKTTAFKWYRDHTHFDPDTEYATIKKLQDIFDNPVVNENRKYSSENTILLDDSEAKTRFNDPNNIIICEAFTGKEDDRFLFELMELIPQKFENLVK